MAEAPLDPSATVLDEEDGGDAQPVTQSSAEAPPDVNQGQVAILNVQVVVDGEGGGLSEKRHEVVFSVEATKASAAFVVEKDASGAHARSSETISLCPLQELSEDSYIAVSVRALNDAENADECQDENDMKGNEVTGRVDVKSVLEAMDSGQSVDVVVGGTSQGDESIEEVIPGEVHMRVSFVVKKLDSDVELLGRPPKTPRKKKKRRPQSKSKSPARAKSKSKSPVRGGNKPRGKSPSKKKEPAKRDGSPKKRRKSPGKKKKALKKKTGTTDENEDTNEKEAEEGLKEDGEDAAANDDAPDGEEKLDGENKEGENTQNEETDEKGEDGGFTDTNADGTPQRNEDGAVESSDPVEDDNTPGDKGQERSAEDEEIARRQAEIDAIMAELDAVPSKPKPPKQRTGKPKGFSRPLAGARYVTAIEKMEMRKLEENELGAPVQDGSKSDDEKESVGWASGGEQEYLWKGSLTARGAKPRSSKASVYSSGRPRGRRGGQRRKAPASVFQLPPLKSKEHMRARENMWDGSNNLNDQRIVHYESIKDPLCHGAFVTNKRQEVLNHIISTEMIMQERSMTEQAFFKILKNGEVSTLSDFHFRNEARGAAAEAENASDFSGSVDANLQKLGELVPHEEYFDRLTSKYDTTEVVAKAAKTMLLDIKEHASSTEAKKVFAMTPGERLLWSSYPDLKERIPRRHILHNRGIYTGKNNTYKEKGH